MTYGEFLRYCRALDGSPTKTDFARKLGLKDGDHYIGAENDKPDKKPSVDLMERAAKLVGLEFTDFIQEPPKRKHASSRKHLALSRKFMELLESGDMEVEIFFETAVETFHKSYLKKR